MRRAASRAVATPVASLAPARADATSRADGGPARTVRAVDAIALTVGTVIGAGIFRTPSVVAANAGSESMALAAWIAGGAISLVGALCYAELTTTYPNAGGDYYFLRRAFGRRLAFLFAWARITVIQTGSIALLAYVIGDYMSGLLRTGPGGAALYAALTVVIVTLVNVAGARLGKVAQTVLTAAEILGLVLVIGAGLLVPAAPSVGSLPVMDAAGGSHLGLVMVFVLLTYGGWNEAAYISAEVRGSRLTMARVLVLSVAIVATLYVLVNWAYLRGLGLAGVAASNAVGADLVERTAGVAGAWLVSALILIGALTSVNAAVFTGARAAYAVGRDHRAVALLGRWHGTAGAPVNALLAQGAVALALVTAAGVTRKGFETIVDYTAPVFWLFFLLTGIALFVLRRREPDITRPFRVPFYPVTPLVFCAVCAYVLHASLVQTGTGAWWGVGVLGAGFVVLALLWRHQGGPR